MQGVQLKALDPYVDARGKFVKYNSTHIFDDLAEEVQFCENFYSTSIVGSIRGFHVQTGESENFRVVHVIKGSIFDVLVDLRLESATFGKFQKRILNASAHESLLIPPGVGHGFQTLEESIVVYASSNEYVSNLDTGINPLKNFKEWPVEITKISDRDLNLPDISEYLKKQKQ